MILLGHTLVWSFSHTCVLLVGTCCHMLVGVLQIADSTKMKDLLSQPRTYPSFQCYVSVLRVSILCLSILRVSCILVKQLTKDYSNSASYSKYVVELSSPHSTSHKRSGFMLTASVSLNR